MTRASIIIFKIWVTVFRLVVVIVVAHALCLLSCLFLCSVVDKIKVKYKKEGNEKKLRKRKLKFFLVKFRFLYFSSDFISIMSMKRLAIMSAVGSHNNFNNHSVSYYSSNEKGGQQGLQTMRPGANLHGNVNIMLGG